VKILRDMIRGEGALLESRKNWLVQFYVGDSKRLHSGLLNGTVECLKMDLT